jgi:hypothetical protein
LAKASKVEIWALIDNLGNNKQKTLKRKKFIYKKSRKAKRCKNKFF